MQHGIPDRVPVWCQLSVGHVELAGFPAGSSARSGEEFIEAQCALVKRYRFDGILVVGACLRRSKSPTGEDTDCLNQGWDGEQQFSGAFADCDPEHWSNAIPSYTADDFYGAQYARSIVGEELHLGGWVPDAFSRACNWFNFNLSEAMMALAEDPARFLALVEWFRPKTIALALAQAQLGGIESVHISSPYAGSGFISREMYQRFVLPGIMDLADALRPLGVFSYIHNCGCIHDRLELMATSGVDGLECMDPPPLGDVRLSDAKARVGKQQFLKGNLDSVNVLLFGDDELVEQTVQQCLLDGSAGGGYILSTACSVAPGVNPERMMRLVDYAERWGHYDHE